GKRKYNKGHHVEGVWVFGIVERSISRKILFFLIKSRNSDILINILRNSFL
ncbi:hypothetical protein H312_02616, partial [Anncaliia algerae PRA339]